MEERTLLFDPSLSWTPQQWYHAVTISPMQSVKGRENYLQEGSQRRDLQKTQDIHSPLNHHRKYSTALGTNVLRRMMVHPRQSLLSLPDSFLLPSKSQIPSKSTLPQPRVSQSANSATKNNAKYVFSPLPHSILPPHGPFYILFSYNYLLGCFISWIIKINISVIK